MSGLFAMLQKTFIILTIVTIAVVAQPTDFFSGRWKAPSTVVAMQGPYTWMDTVNTQAANYSVPNGYLACEMRVTDSCLIRVKLRSRDSMTIRACAGDIFRLDLLKIYKTGTDSTAGCLNKIRLFGIKE